MTTLPPGPRRPESPARLSARGFRLFWSGKRDSNSRPRPWQGRALPTELFPPTLITWAPHAGFGMTEAGYCNVEYRSVKLTGRTARYEAMRLSNTVAWTEWLERPLFAAV